METNYKHYSKYVTNESSTIDHSVILKNIAFILGVQRHNYGTVFCLIR